jgi:hypothetical protein
VGEDSHQPFKLWPVGGRAGDLLAVHFFATGHLQLAHLSGFVLGGRRDARLAVNHAANFASEICIEKGQFHPGRRDDANILTSAYHVALSRSARFGVCRLFHSVEREHAPLPPTPRAIILARSDQPDYAARQAL